MSQASNGPDSDPINPQSLGLLLVGSSVIALAAIRHGRIVFANPAFHDEFHATGSLIGVPLAAIVTDSGDDRLEDAIAATEQAPISYLGTGSRGSESTFDVALNLEVAMVDGESTVIAFASDVTARHRSSEQLAYLAYTDALTGLANRARLADRLHQAMLQARRSGAAFAVLAIDLDGFKAVNDAHGHDAGDTVLQLAVRRFQRCIRDSDTLARPGGDEFTVLLSRLESREGAALVAQRMIDALSMPLDLGHSQVNVGASIGIAIFPEHARTVDGLLAAADTALYRAKRAGKHQYQWATGRFSAEALSVPSLTWNAAHLVGIDEIDAQHAHLAELIDTLSAALKEDADKSGIQAGLNELIGYTEFHFATEERLMSEHDVADLARHRHIHQRLLQDIRRLDVSADMTSISLILRYLQEWLLRYIDGADRQLGRILIAKGCH